MIPPRRFVINDECFLIDQLRSRVLSNTSANPQFEKNNVEERAPWLALLPIFLTGLFYFLPSALQEKRLIQFLPQLSAYLALALWSSFNSGAAHCLGVKRNGLVAGIKWGAVIGLLLGGMNAIVILWVVPRLGGDILFLKDTPHAHMPTWVMFPWGILVIAISVELNFRGFLLGRLETLYCQRFRDVSLDGLNAGSFLAVVSSALVFAFDPFMVMTFQRLHWIALWDGLVWGWMFVRMKNLHAVIVAHAVEVMILYASIKAALM